MGVILRYHSAAVRLDTSLTLRMTWVFVLRYRYAAVRLDASLSLSMTHEVEQSIPL